MAICAWYMMNALTLQSNRRTLLITAPWCLLVLFVMLLLSLPLNAQTCKQGNPSSTPLNRFQFHKNGTISDKRSGLIWMRCSLGQTWNGNSCQGPLSKLTWLQAAEKAANSTFANRKWRLASVSELSGIIELRCENPAINLVLFPNTPASHYWTATTFVNQSSSHWLVQFRYGENHTDKDSAMAFVRLVSD